jgi:hypothetical protein
MLWPSPPLSLHYHLSRCAAASIATPTPVSLHLSRTSGWLLHSYLSRHASASLGRHLSRCAVASLVAPHLRRLGVDSPTILTCRRLSCRAGWLSPCYLSRCAAVSLGHRPSQFLGGLPLSIRCSGMGRKASCGALKGNFRQLRPWW